MKENQGWREAYNKIIFEQVDINEETIPNFIQQEINKAVLEALQKQREEILNFDWDICDSCRVELNKTLSNLTTK